VALLAVRAGLARVAVVVVTSVAHILGPKWSGLVTGYLVNALPVIAVLHFHYGLDVIRAMAKVWPIGVLDPPWLHRRPRLPSSRRHGPQDVDGARSRAHRVARSGESRRWRIQ